jgi:hypothetical protein
MHAGLSASISFRSRERLGLPIALQQDKRNNPCGTATPEKKGMIGFRSDKLNLLGCILSSSGITAPAFSKSDGKGENQQNDF